MSVVVASYGGGTNSTAMLIECAKRGEQVDLILFADTGGEKPHTYQYVEMFSDWLVEHGMPRIIIVRNGGIAPRLEDDCLRRNSLPAIAYGFKTCSLRYKVQPQEKYINNCHWLQSKLDDGHEMVKLIGFDADEPQRAKDYPDVRYPLIEWDMGRDECIESIESAGLCLPGKSACFFCPSSKPSEIRQLAKVYPDLAERAIAMEKNAKLTTIKGLGRNYAWADLLSQAEMFDDDYAHTPELACGCYDG